jgi:hypothetical protein
MRIAVAGTGDRRLSDRAERLKRLLAIRLLTEELDRNALQIALSAVSDVETALATLDHAMTESKLIARAALAKGDRRDWMLADAQGEVAGWNLSKLKKLLAERTEVAESAKKKFIESRREQEQVKQLVKDAQQTARIQEVRRAQAAADDWFLGKRTPEIR